MSRAALALLLIACGTSAPAIDAGTDAPADAHVIGDIEGDYCAPFARMLCTRAASCDCGVSDVEGCVARRTASCVAATHGTLVLAAWEPCAARLSAMDPCATLSLEQCTPFLATFGDGGVARCVDFAPCPTDGGDGICLGGACDPLPGVGASCLASRICGPDLRCDGQTITCAPFVDDVCTITDECRPPTRCLGGHCVASIAEGGACATSEQCTVGLACTGGVCAAVPDACTDLSCPRDTTCERRRVCRAPGALGDPCDTDDGDTCGPSGVCRGFRCVPPPLEGEPCFMTCMANATCVLDNTMGTSTCVANASAGERCASDAFAGVDTLPQCRVGLVCDEVCRVPELALFGQRCNDTHPCAPPSVCNGHCISPLGLNAPCARGADGADLCTIGLVCDGTVCVRTPSVGDACDPMRPDCPCLPGASGTPACQPPRAVGDPCDDVAAPCASGLLCRVAAPSHCVAGICEQLRHP